MERDLRKQTMKVLYHEEKPSVKVFAGISAESGKNNPVMTVATRNRGKIIEKVCENPLYLLNFCAIINLYTK